MENEIMFYIWHGYFVLFKLINCGLVIQIYLIFKNVYKYLTFWTDHKSFQNLYDEKT